MPKILNPDNGEVEWYVERMAKLAFHLHFAKRFRYSKHNVIYLREQLAFVVKAIGYPDNLIDHPKKGTDDEET